MTISASLSESAARSAGIVKEMPVLYSILSISAQSTGRRGHFFAPTNITPIYMTHEFTIFIAYLVKGPERNVQGVVMCKEQRMTVGVMNFRADTCYLHREYGRSSCLLCSITLKTELQWLGPLYRYLFVVATYTFYTLSRCQIGKEIGCTRLWMQMRRV